MLTPRAYQKACPRVAVRTFSNSLPKGFVYSVTAYNEAKESVVPGEDNEQQQQQQHKGGNAHGRLSSRQNNPSAAQRKSGNPALSKDKLDLSLLEKAYKKYEQISLNSMESTYLTSKISPLDTPNKLKNYLVENKKDAKFQDFKNFNYLPINFAINQNIKLKDNNSAERLKQILASFRNSPIKYCFAYGSSVFKQANNDPNKKTQTDLIFATTFPDHFHSLNLNRNNDHYSFMKKFGSGFITKVQNVGPGVYFNPYVKVNNSLVKYGVVSIEKTINDLLNWDNMYIAGRLHKPVKILKDDARIRFINQENLRNAVSVSLLLMLSTKNNANNTFSVTELFETIAGLSYSGDIRTKIGGESPKKVSNIVSGQFAEFQELYAPLFQIFLSDEFISFTNAELSTFQINDADTYKAYLIQNLPFEFKSKLYQTFAAGNGNRVAVSEQVQDVLSGASKPQFHDTFTSSSSFYATNGNRKQNFIFQQPPSSYVDACVSSLEYNDLETFKPDAYALALANDPFLNGLLKKALERTIMYPSIVQSVKGVFTAGLAKSFSYAKEKRSKYNKGMK